MHRKNGDNLSSTIFLAIIFRINLLQREAQYRGRFFAEKIGDIGNFGDMRSEIRFLFKNRKRESFRNEVIIKKGFQFYKEFNNWFKSTKTPKCVELSTPPNAIKHKLKKQI
jgi:hypothetical protein